MSEETRFHRLRHMTALAGSSCRAVRRDGHLVFSDMHQRNVANSGEEAR